MGGEEWDGRGDMMLAVSWVELQSLNGEYLLQLRSLAHESCGFALADRSLKHGVRCE